ncbi:MAG: DUF488 family protein [Chloroflexi bacterium]|nr:MAG: DUF488 family protein [Chloroflexota bacterium]
MRLKIQLERVYTARTNARGKRILVDRLWPRGVRKDALKLDLWLRELAPSNELRKWFGHDPRRWEEFERRYYSELQRPERQEQLHELLALARKGPVTLLYGARDEEHNEAVVLRKFLEGSPKK